MRKVTQTFFSLVTQSFLLNERSLGRGEKIANYCVTDEPKGGLRRRPEEGYRMVRGEPKIALEIKSLGLLLELFSNYLLLCQHVINSNNYASGWKTIIAFIHFHRKSSHFCRVKVVCINCRVLMI